MRRSIVLSLSVGSLLALAASCSKDERSPSETGGAAGAHDAGSAARAGRGGDDAGAGRGGSAGNGGSGALAGSGGGGTGGAGGGADASAGAGGTAGGGRAGSGGGGTGGAAGASGGKDAGPPTDALSTDAAVDRTDTPMPATTYVYTSGYDPKIGIHTLDLSSGLLTARGTVDTGVSSPSYLAFSPDRRFLYAANEASGANSKVLAYRIDSSTGSLQKINEGVSGGDGAPHLSVTPDGKWVLVAHYGSGHVSVLGVDANGGVAAAVDVQRPANETSHQVVTDRSGSAIFVPNVNANTVFQFKLENATGKLTANGSVAGFPSGAGPRHVAFHPSEKWAYTMNELGLSVSSLLFDAAAGTLSSPQTIDSLPGGAAKTGTGAHVLVHPGGRFVYTSNRGHNSISVFEVDSATGRLAMRHNETGGGAIRTPRDFAMDPSGKFLLVANQDAANVMVFEIDAADGKLMLRDTKPTAPKPSFVGAIALP